MSESPVQLGVQSFAGVSMGPDGSRPSDGEVLRRVVEHGALAEQLEIDAYGLGEHHRDDFVSSSPEVALAAIAGRTERITLSSAVTVLTTDDPVRAYQRWATLDGISSGRAEPILGRGSFTESFPLFGFDVADYEPLFEERLNLWAQLREEGPIRWQGARAALWPYYEAMFSRIGRERGWPPQSKENFEAAIDSGANLVGSPETAANQLTELILTVGLDRVDINYDVGPLPHDMKTRSLELLGREVYPRVRDQLAERRSPIHHAAA